MNMRIGGLAAALASAALLAACGSSGSSSSTTSSTSSDTSSFAAAADKICTVNAYATVDLHKKYEPVKDAQSASELAGALQNVLADAQKKLKALQPPDSVNSAYQDFLSQRDQMVSLLGDGVKAANANDEKAYNASEQKYFQVSQDADAAASDAGLTACAEKLSDSQASDAREVLTRTATSTDPSQCENDYTSAFVQARFGSIAACRKQQGGAMDSLDIKSVQGVDNIYATATVVAHGGSLDGQTLDVEMIYEDGSWKLDSISSEPSS